MNRPEEALQRAVVEWLEWSRPRWKGRMAYFAVPNQRGTRSRAEAGVLKAMGVRPGVSDLVFFAHPGRAFCVELKAPGREGRLSPAQEEWLEECSRVQVPVYVASSVGDVEEVLGRQEVLRPARGKAAPEGSLWK